MSSKDLNKRLKRVPQQERSIVRFETVVAATLKLLSERSYEAISMREIAREADMPIASVYQYFPTKLSIVHEIWSRYTDEVYEHLEAELARIQSGDDNDIGVLIDGMVDLMVMAQREQQAFVEVWACVAAAPELRELNTQDTIRTAELIAETMGKLGARMPTPEEIEVFQSISIIMCESAGATTKLAMALPEPLGGQTIRQLKQSLRWIYEGAVRKLDEVVPG
ncbi:TetR/AcrR family transcriptional regulator [Gynuella sp.]|uniref:TetR/AcrR family transcriptional regulator n=1 Tax=Gynuella sp. TaxID=2969146 RepID=UPI003D0D2BFD